MPFPVIFEEMNLKGKNKVGITYGAGAGRTTNPPEDPFAARSFGRFSPVGVENSLPQSHGHAPLEHLPEATQSTAPCELVSGKCVLPIHGTGQPCQSPQESFVKQMESQHQLTFLEN